MAKLWRLWQMGRQCLRSLSGRVVLAMIGIFSLVLTSSGVALWSTTRLDLMDKQIRSTTRVAEAVLPALRADLHVIRSRLGSLIESPSRLAERRFNRDVSALEASIDTRLQELQQTFPGDPTLVLDIRSALSLWPALRRDIQTALTANDPVAAYSLGKTEGAGLLADVIEKVSIATEAALWAARKQSATRDDVVRQFLVTEVMLLVVCLLAAIAGVVVLQSRVIQPSRDIIAAISEIADGKLSTSIPHAKRGDEIGQIARATQVFLEHAIAVRDSNFDLVTGLPGRSHLHNHIEIYRLDPSKTGLPATLLRVDLDRFGEINDTFGRAMGDNVLIRVGEILRRFARLGDFVARDTGDSFFLMSVGRTAEQVYDSVARPLCREIAEPFSVGGHDLALSACIGIAEFDPDAATDDLLRGTEHALAEAQSEGPGTVTIYTQEMNARLQRRRETLSGLRFALTHGEIVSFFQPQVDTISGEVAGMEALVRWNHPELGVMAPWQFLDIAQDAGLMPDLTDTMIAKALGQLSEWQKSGFSVHRISINVTAIDLRRADFVDRLALMTEQAGLDPDQVCVELLESAMIEHTDDPLSRSLDRLLKLGFPIELDDFGTGHAAVSTLQLIKLSGVKIDRSFITRLHESPDQRRLARAMLSLARAMEVTCIAEGVECLEERVVLSELGCDLVQGFGIARPMSGHDATIWLENYIPKRLTDSDRLTA